MKRRLFLTGDIGAGKSTAIAAALGDRLQTLGGFLTRRHLGADGKPRAFSLALPDGSREEIFLDLSGGHPLIHMEVFETLGIPALQGEVLILDEIGGIELLNPRFAAALERILTSDIPVIGVWKAPSAAEALSKVLGLTEEYRRRADRLEGILSADAHTLLYTCEKYDEKALTLAKAWVGEFCK